MYKYTMSMSVRTLFPVVMGLCLSQTAFGGTWRLAPSLTVTETYTDNVNLDTAERQGDFVTQVSPTLLLTGEGARLNTTLSYTPNYFYFPGAEDDKDEFRHRLEGNLSSELVRDLFFVDAAARISQQFLDRRAAIASVEANRTENRSTVQAYQINPYVQHRFGGFATARLGGTVSHVRSDADETTVGGVFLSNSTRYGADFSLASGTDFSRLGWVYSADYSFEERQTTSDFKTYNTRLSLSYRFSRMFTLLGSAGYTKREVNSIFADFDGFVWDAGFRLIPGPRTSLSFRYGNQYDGDTFAVDAFYRISAQTQISLSYDDRIQTFQSLVLGDALIDEFTGELIPGQLFVSDNLVRTKTWRLTLTGTRGRTTFSVGGFYRDFESEVSELDEKRWVGSLSLTRRLSPRLSVSTSGTYNLSNFEDTAVDDKFWTASANMSYRLSESLTSSLSYTHSDREGSRFPLFNRASNFISLSIRASL